jgi:coniferyl-aldehyde dehydrogenase
VVRPDERCADPAFYGSAQAAIRMQPKGVIGNIVPWNFPFDLSCGPLVEMLAAGNRVVIKPSDYTPACAELLDEMVRATFDRDLVAVSVGGLELARTFPTLRWDHLLYTGSPEIGRVVAKAAAENLVPVTLELGGKCPAVIAGDALDAETVKTVMGTKMIKNGQMCISVDYVMVPRAQVDRFVELGAAVGRTGLRRGAGQHRDHQRAAPGPADGSGRRGPRRGGPCRARSAARGTPAVASCRSRWSSTRLLTSA